MPESANPETCLHRVLGLAVSGNIDVSIVCISCDSTIDLTFLDKRDYDYDIDHNVWVQQGPTRR